ncbi:hypothetical protein J5N97_016927 [Dioscorea zingiberensis]|uniref:EF-hand domain-containing protein n=1 Tax=Dioscorea zingiberensis TaxID=325984 RepID=A0A9D5CKX2_9LILI|nr:hypothetical protein J5N97_016927 [Dioscorea zingiberensis]
MHFHLIPRPAEQNPNNGAAVGPQMSEQQFRKWLTTVDVNGDGRISRKELQDALRVLGLRCTRWKSWRAFVHADLNKNKHIEGESEIEELIEYARKRWGILVS